MMRHAKIAQPEWIKRAEQLMIVRRTCLSFLDRWAVGRLTTESAALERVAADVQARAEAALADPHNRDWSLLYRGTVLDD